MKLKNIILICGSPLFLCTQTSAFSTNKTIVLTAPQLEISKQGENTDITLNYTLTNNSEEEVLFTEMHPLPAGTTNPQLYIDSDGIEIETQTGKKKLEFLWDMTEKNKDLSFLSFGDDQFPSLATSPVIKISPQTSFDVKYQYTVSLPKEQSWQWLSLFLPESQDMTQLKLSYAEGQHTLSNIKQLQTSLPLSHDGQTFIQETIPSTGKNQWITWNTEANPISTDYKNFTYTLHTKPQNPFKPEKATLLLDQSGSINQAKWQKTVETVRFLLNDILQNKEVQIGLFADEVEWLTVEDGEPIFEPNTFELRQRIFGALEINRPIGKTDLKKIIEEYNDLDSTVPNHALTLITDEVSPDDTFTLPTAVLHLGTKDERDTWKYTTQNNHHWLLPLYHTQPSLVEADTIRQHWNQWRQSDTSFEKELPAKDTEYILFKTPSHTLFPQIAIGRRETSSKKNTIPWITTTWAKEKIKQLQNNLDKTETDNNAINSIQTVFGLRDNAQFVNDIPSYLNARQWQTYNFDEQKNENTDLDIAPFSETQRYLFLNYAPEVSTGFSLGTSTNFCTTVRCLRVHEDGAADLSPFIKAYWNEKDKNHWALPYVQTLLKKNQYPINDNGNLELEKPISRGDFIQMMYEQIDTYRWRQGTPLTFTDLPEDNPYHEAITWFSQHKIITGYLDETVRPQNKLTRAEAVKILLATDGYKPSEGAEVPLFADSTTWELPWVNEAQRRNYVQGFSPTKFSPHKPLTKGQAAKLIVKFFEE